MLDEILLFVFVVVFNKEEDIAAYMIKGLDDPRTLNKTLYVNPPKNTLSMNELVTLWEKKIGKSLEKTHMAEEQVLKNIQGIEKFIKNQITIYYCLFSYRRLKMICSCFFF